MPEFPPKRLFLCGIVACAVSFVAVAAARDGIVQSDRVDAIPNVILAETAATPVATSPIAVPFDPSRPQAYVWSARRLDSLLMLRGFVPSEEDRRTVIGMAKAHFAELEIEDRLKVTDGGPPKEQWLGAVSFGLKQLSHLKRGSARLLNDGLKMEGEARSADDYAEAQKALTAMPAGLVLLNDNIRPPVVDPFTFMASLSSTALTLTGSVPNEDIRKSIRDWSRRYFERPTLDDRLQLASGAPKKWDDAVEASLRALSQLDSGKVSLSGVAISIEGLARDKGTAIAVAYQLRRDLPALFSSSESIRWKEADISRTLGVGELIAPRIKEAAHSDGIATGAILPAGD